MAAALKLLAETTAPVDEIAQILRAEHGDPFHILGAHIVEWHGQPAVAIRAFLPRAHEAWVLRGESEAVPLQRIHAEGFFEAVFPGEHAVFPYRLRTDYAGHHEFEDPYRFPARSLGFRPLPSGGGNPPQILRKTRRARHGD